MTDDTKTPNTGMFRKGGYMGQNPDQKGEVATLAFDYEAIDKLPNAYFPSEVPQESAMERMRQTVRRFSSKGASVLLHSLPRIAAVNALMTGVGREAIKAAEKLELSMATKRAITTGFDLATMPDTTTASVYKRNNHGWELDALIEDGHARTGALTAAELSAFINSDGINPHTRTIRKAQVFGMMYGNATMRAMVIGRRRDAEIAQANIAAERAANALREMFRPKFRLRHLHLEVLRAMEEVAKAGH